MSNTSPVKPITTAIPVTAELLADPTMREYVKSRLSILAQVEREWQNSQEESDGS